MWHRLFGQDVTLWGPTHLMLIGGASLATLGGMVLHGRGDHLAWPQPRARRGTPWIYNLRRALLVGGFLVALSTFQAEFDFGVPQFRAVFHPILSCSPPASALVATRLYLGRGGALLDGRRLRGPSGASSRSRSAGVFGPDPLPHFPLYIVEALLVEAVFARAGGRSPVVNGAIAGALIGTVGLAAEWAWSHVWMPIPGTTRCFPRRPWPAS